MRRRHLHRRNSNALRALTCVALVAVVVVSQLVVSVEASSYLPEEDQRRLQQPRRRRQQQQQQEGYTSTSNGTLVVDGAPQQQDGGDGEEDDLFEPPLIRIWVSYKANVTHNESLGSLQTNLEQALELPANATNFDGLLVPDQDMGVPPTRRRRRIRRAAATDGNARRGLQPEEIVAGSFQMHYDFFETAGVGSIAMSVTPQVLEALQSDPNVRKVRVDPPRYPLHLLQPTEPDPMPLDAPPSGHLRHRRGDGHRHRQRELQETAPYGIRMVNAAGAWRRGYRGQRVTVRTQARQSDAAAD
jgi:hypothetical protein